jgi:hypothetical protein
MHVEQGHFQEGEHKPWEVRKNERANERSSLMGTTDLDCAF